MMNNSTKMEFHTQIVPDHDETWNQEIDVSETLQCILDEVRSLKEQLERNNEETRTVIENLTDEVKTLRSELGDMKNQYIEPKYKVLPEMPFNKMDDLKNFDDKLPMDDEMRDELKTFLQRIPGKDFTSFLRTALRALVTDELGVNLTWRGTPDKPSIQRFTVFMILRDLCHVKFENSTHSEINRICQQHFLHAKDRVTKKQKPYSFTKEKTAKDIKPKIMEYSISSPTSVLPIMPFITLSDFQDFDDKLENDNRIKAALKTLINRIDGRDHAAFSRAAFRAIVTDELAMELSWRGTIEKPSIQDFAVFSIIRKTCQAKYESATLSDINKIIQQHFLHAKDRVSKRIKLS